MTDLFDLAGRTALVTGSSRGLGRAMAEGLARAGTAIVLNGSDPGRLDRAVAEMGAAGMEAPGLGVDLLPAVYERPDLSVRISAL